MPITMCLTVGPVGQSDEVADCAVFLASAVASQITGHCLVVDGGQVVKLS